VRADPNVTLTTKSGTTKYVATETPVANRALILYAYKVKAGKIVEAIFVSCPIQPTIRSSRTPLQSDSSAVEGGIWRGNSTRRVDQTHDREITTGRW
jgi:hypothetical protein